MECFPITADFGPRFVPGVIGCIGGLILHQEYDVRQLWFDFMAGSVMRLPNPSKATPQPPEYRPRKWNTTGFAKMGDHGRTMYLYEKGQEQLQLPFNEFRSLSKTEHSRLVQSQYAGWDKPNGKPIVFRINPDTHKDARRWCVENLKGRYHLKPESLSLQLAQDAVMAKIFWQTGKS
jgi:hypothetical protein